MTATGAPSSEKPRLMIVTASVREGRKGAAVAEWIGARAVESGRFDVDQVDLKELDLPLADEPNHPRLRRYVHEHTRAWSDRVDRADAFVFVTPEYNHAMPAALKNAIDYLHQEWANKPVGFVSYGGVSGGTRAVQSLRPVAAALKMVALPEGVIIPFVANSVDETGTFVATEIQEQGAQEMFGAILRWTEVLAPMREPAPTGGA